MIELENITRVYRMGKVDVYALNGVSLSISEGEMVAIVGVSGSGKSTLLNMIGCLDRPTSGRYILDGADVSQLNDNKLAEIRNKKLGFVFQEFNLLSRATALANVELPLIYGNSRQKRRRAMEALERVGLGARAKHKPTELSGGEQQRVAIARAVVKNPDIILADEPTGNLDAATALETLDLLTYLAEDQGCTVVVATHDYTLMTKKRGRLIEISEGRLLD